MRQTRSLWTAVAGTVNNGMEFKEPCCVGLAVHERDRWMIGIFLFLVLFLAITRQLRGWPPAARVGFAAAFSLACPIFVLSLLARIGIAATAIPVVIVFAVLTGLALVRSPQKPQSLDVDPEPPATQDRSSWLTATAVALLVAALTALLGRPPTMDPLVDPWAHLAWSRDLPNVHRLYSIGFPTFYAIMGLDDRLLGAFRFAPMLLHAALAVQFIALGERFGKLWPGAVAAFAFLVVPVAFGKFDPPRPILLAAVFITASWWIFLFDQPGRRWKISALAFLTCVLVTTHASVVELTYLVGLVTAIIIGSCKKNGTDWIWLVLAIGLAAGAGLIVSPYPVLLFFKPDAHAAITDTSRAIAVPRLIEFARMWGLGLGFAAIAAAFWIVFHFKTAWKTSRGALAGIAVWFALCLLPVALASVGIQVPNTLATYRYLLAAALPLAIGITIVAAMAVDKSAIGKIGVIVCTLVVALDSVLRPAFPILNGLIALGLVAAVWTIVTRVTKQPILMITAVICLTIALAIRLVIWFPSPPPEAIWLEEKGDPDIHVITNWPITNTLDALAPQPVLDGLAGVDANLGLHRAEVTTSLRNHISWCGDGYATGTDSLLTVLDDMGALPAYLVIGDSFEQAWSIYAEQREARAQTDSSGTDVFFAAEPCSKDPATRLEAIRDALDGHPRIRREMTSGKTAIYRIE